jgi:hypothetical protein
MSGDECTCDSCRCKPVAERMDEVDAMSAAKFDLDALGAVIARDSDAWVVDLSAKKTRLTIVNPERQRQAQEANRRFSTPERL